METEVCNSDDTREHTRRKFYKKPVKRDNFRLEEDNDLPQEQRRKLLLEKQKQCRDETINAARGILYDLIELDDEDDEDMPMDVENLASESNLSNCTQARFKLSRMMLSEWMLEVPEDFSENWIMIPCPRGKRTRVISRKGITKAYSRKGVLCGVFPSALPGGNPDTNLHNSAVLDCIWVQSQKVYYVLDVLYWGKMPFTNCEADFRLFWISNKIREMKEFEERDTDTNRYPILFPQRFNCDSDLSTALTNLEHELSLDGLLFYHRNGYYCIGYTPLVTWLRPFMLPEILGISVPSPFDKKPDNYINFEHHIHKMKSKKTMHKKNVNEESMEVI